MKNLGPHIFNNFKRVNFFKNMDYRIINSLKKLGITFVFILFTLSAFSWGATGHRVTGWIAEKHISKKVKKELDRILGGQSLAMASNWMDEVRSDSTYDYAVDW